MRRTVRLRDAKLQSPGPDQPSASPAIALSRTHWLIVTSYPPERGLEQTVDAGRHWLPASIPKHQLTHLLAADEPVRHLSYPNVSGPIEKVFTSGGEGWRIPGVLPNESPSFPPYGEVDFTSDGGRHWRDTGQFADGFSALPGGFALISGVFKGDDELLVTRDGGQHWEILTPIERLGAYTSGSLGRVVDQTDISGAFISADAGEHWASASTTDERLTAVPGLLVGLDTAGERCRLLVSTDDGQHYRVLATPGVSIAHQTIPPYGFISCGADQFAFGTRALGVASTTGLIDHKFWRTVDGGRTWRTVPGIVPRPADGTSVLASGRLDVVITGYRTVALSHDGGRTWAQQRFSHGHCGAVTAWAAHLWVACGHVIFTSPNAGVTWTELNAPARFVPLTITAVGPHTLLAAAPPPGYDPDLTPAPGSLWRTRDGGVAWTRFWPRLPIGP